MDLKAGDIVRYCPCDGFEGKAEVVGIATIGAAVIERSIMLKDLSGNIPNETYPFQYFCCFEVHLKKVE